MSSDVFNPRAPAFQPALSPTVTYPFSEGGRGAEPVPVRGRWAFFDLHVSPGDGSGLIPRTYSATSIRTDVQAEDVESVHGQGNLFDFDFWVNGDHQLLLAKLAPPRDNPRTTRREDGCVLALETYTARFFTRTPANYGRLHALHKICGRRISALPPSTGLIPTNSAERQMEQLLRRLNKHLRVFQTSDWDELLETIGKVQVTLAGDGRERREHAGSKLPKLWNMRGRSPVGAGVQSTSLGWCSNCDGPTKDGCCAFSAACEEPKASPVGPEAMLNFLCWGSSGWSRVVF